MARRGPAPDPRQRRFLDLYRQYLKDPVRPAELQLRALFAEWEKPDYWAGSGDREALFSPSPVQGSQVRVKRPESVLDKLEGKPESFPEGLSVASLDRMHDVVGGRLVVYFMTDLPMVDRAIRTDDRLELSQDDPPMAYLPAAVVARLGMNFGDAPVAAKPSGYQSLHYVARFREPFASRAIWFEIQVRTLAQNTWAEVEHLLGYKPDVHVPFHIEQQLTLLANVSTVLDDEFELVRSELDDVLRSGEDIDDAEELAPWLLPGLTHEAGLRVSRAFARTIVSGLSSRGVRTAGSFRRLLKSRATADASGPALGARELVGQIYRSELQRDPRDRELIMCLSNIADLLGRSGKVPREVATGRIRAQIEYNQQALSMIDRGD